MDVTSLFLLHGGSFKASKYFLDKDSNKSISTDTILKLIEFVPKLNISFQWPETRCCHGKEIGRTVACLFMGHLEELFFAQYEHSTTILYKRYIDNIAGAASCSERELQCFINFVKKFNMSIK